MARYSFEGFQEVFAATAADRNLVESGLKSGAIRRIRQALYSTNTVDPVETIVKRNLWLIVSILCKGCVVSHRTAVDGKPTPDGTVVVTGKYDRKIIVTGLLIRQMKGPGPLQGDQPFINGLYMSSRARFFLEVLSGKVYGTESPYLTTAQVETLLERLMVIGEPKMNEMRDLAREIADDMNMQSEFARLDSITGALMGTQFTKLSSNTAIARQKGEPYDEKRIQLFQLLFEELSDFLREERPEPPEPGESFQNAGFFDAYFSNFIEGTEFLVEEAREIVFENKIPVARPEDAHDVLGTYRIVGNRSSMATKMSTLSSKDFLSIIKQWHATILNGRPDKRPGQFKETPNRVGNTIFVEPNLVRGTLAQGFEMGRALRAPFGRSAFLLFLISEVHPFDDGNGRIARAVANAELISNGQRRVLIPTVYRTEYLDSLRQLSRESKSQTFIRMFDRAHEFTTAIDFSVFNNTKAQLEDWCAFDTDADARLSRPR